jgi:hypothetical protein
MERQKKRTISFTVMDFEYEEILMYSRIKGHGGQYPISNFAHYSLFQQMKKYPLKPSETVKYQEEYGKAGKGPKAVQPLKPQANKRGSTKQK